MNASDDDPIADAAWIWDMQRSASIKKVTETDRPKFTQLTPALRPSFRWRSGAECCGTVIVDRDGIGFDAPTSMAGALAGR